MKLLFYEAADWVTHVTVRHAAGGTSGQHMHEHEDCENGLYSPWGPKFQNIRVS